MSTNVTTAKTKNLKMVVETLDVEPMQSFVVEHVEPIRRFDGGLSAAPRKQKEPELEFFNPTREMVQARIRLMTCLSSQQISASTIADIPNLAKYAYPIKQQQLEDWSNMAGFWVWFVGADEVDAEMYMLRRKAFSTVKNVMELPEEDDLGLPIHKNISLKLQTSRFIMAETAPKQAPANTVINNNILNNMPQRRASVRREPMEQLRQRVERLKTANNVQSIEAEVINNDG